MDQSKSDLLHDIICRANNLSNYGGFIIAGVDEKTDCSICDVKVYCIDERFSYESLSSFCARKSHDSHVDGESLAETGLVGHIDMQLRETRFYPKLKAIYLAEDCFVRNNLIKF